MESKIKIFNNPEFGEIRVTEINGYPFFVGKDVAIILGYAKPENAISTHVDDDDKTSTLIQGSGSNYKSKTIVINESGVYSLVFSSKLPQAKSFKHWVTSDVLPSIRKHGAYATDDTIDKIIANPDFGIKLLTELKEEREKRIESERQNAILMHVNKTYTATEIAKECNLKSANELNKMLNDKGVQFKSGGTWVMYSKYANLGYEEIKQEVLDNGHVIYHRKFTQIGRKFIIDLLNH